MTFQRIKCLPCDKCRDKRQVHRTSGDYWAATFMQQRISPASALTGAITLPGDKSISHRYAMISAIADGESRIHNYSTGADCHSTLGCVRALGIDVEVAGTEVVIRGKGLDGLRAPSGDLDAGNSGSTIRMLSGILAAQPFLTREQRVRSRR